MIPRRESTHWLREFIDSAREAQAAEMNAMPKAAAWFWMRAYACAGLRAKCEEGVRR